jgi:signal transduction histidine kinase
VFRIFQEGLTNVTRHARAEHVEVAIAFGDSLSLDVRDDGVGITPEAAQSRKSLGLLGVRERAHRFGGSVVVEAIEPHGTRIALRVPLPPRAAGAPAP